MLSKTFGKCLECGRGLYAVSAFNFCRLYIDCSGTCLGVSAAGLIRTIPGLCSTVFRITCASKYLNALLWLELNKG